MAEGLNSTSTPSAPSSPPRRPRHDRVAQAVIEGFDALPGRGKPQGRAWTVLAGLVVERESSELTLLALATGTRCVGIEAMAAGRGQVVHDCHAEVLCRRAFQRYLLQELSGGPAGPAGAILEAVRPRPSPTWRLRPGVRLHFYVSALPCGECALVPISSSDQGTLARKWLRKEQGEVVSDRNRTGARPIETMPADPKADGAGFHRFGVLRYKCGRSDTRPENRNVSFSCSEKVCRWNHTGWQGSLLARLIEEPILMSSIVIGGPLFEEGFVRHVLYGRAEAEANGSCPEFKHTLVPFSCSREALEGPESARAWTKVSTAGLCLVWTKSHSPDDETAGALSAMSSRSISRGVEGFYDVIIGHTGQRQGLRVDKKGLRKVAEPAEGQASSSWVSPLCKLIMAQDFLHVLRVIVGTEAIGTWLNEGSEAAPKRRRVELGEDVVNTSYSWLKGAASSGSIYRERRQRFHAREPFLHWCCKQTLEFSGVPNGIDGFSCFSDAATVFHPAVAVLPLHAGSPTVELSTELRELPKE